MKMMTRRKYTGTGKVNGTDGDFTCRHCGALVSSDPAISGVRNRNHCPYCLASRHVDLFDAGDRLSPCKGTMHAIGLTLKYHNKKYPGQGELMLVHCCEDCGTIILNRIARDDSTSRMHHVLRESANLDEEMRQKLAQQAITLLKTSQSHLVR